MRLSLLSLFTLVVIAGCVKEEYLIDDRTDVVELTPTFAIPLVQSELSLEQLERSLDTEDFVSQTDAGVLAVVYSQSIIKYSVEQLLDFPSLETDGEFEADALVSAIFNNNSAGEEFEFSQALMLPFNFDNGEQIDSARFDVANLSVEALSTFDHSIQVVITIPELTLNGEIFTTTINLDYTGTPGVSLDTEVDISNHLLDLSNSMGDGIDVNLDFTVTHSGEQTDIGDRLDFSIGMAAESIEYAYGYLGQVTEIAEQDTQEVDLFENIDGGFFYFDDPALELTINNSSGIPVSLGVNSIYNPDNAGGTTISGGGLSDIPLVPGANFPGETASVVHRIDNDNLDPDLSDLMSSGPAQIIYNAEMTTNPDGFSQNFVTAESEVEVVAKIILPLSGYGQSYTFSDTLEMDLGEDLGLETDSAGALSTDDIDKATLRLIIDNGLPLDAELQVVFLNEEGEALDSLFDVNGTKPIISSGLVLHNLTPDHPDYGRVISPTRELTDIVVSQEKLQKLVDLDASQLIIRAQGQTPEAENEEIVRFYPDYRMDVTISAKVEMKLDLSESSE